jgi:mannose/fructose-specific phosphotransferase system component IIA
VPVRHEVPDEQVRSMIGIVLVTHGRLASEFRAALEHVVGPQKQIESVTIGADDDIEQRRQDIVSAAAKVDSGAGVVVLTDMFGGTPSNLAISIMDSSNIARPGGDPGPGCGPQIYLCREPGIER